MSRGVSDVEDIEARHQPTILFSFFLVFFFFLLLPLFPEQILALNARVRTVASLTPTKVTHKVRRRKISGVSFF